VNTVKVVLLVLYLVCASLCCAPVSEAGPLRRIASAPYRIARNVRANRLERWGGELARHRLGRGLSGGGWGGSCANGSCSQ
jgi:hypothetical protein